MTEQNQFILSSVQNPKKKMQFSVLDLTVLIRLERFRYLIFVFILNLLLLFVKDAIANKAYHNTALAKSH